jgi:hypothetical protein
LIGKLTGAKRTLRLHWSTVAWGRGITGDYRISLLLCWPIHALETAAWNLEQDGQTFATDLAELKVYGKMNDGNLLNMRSPVRWAGWRVGRSWLILPVS